MSSSPILDTAASPERLESKEEPETSQEQQQQSSAPESKYFVGEKVYARDDDGILYPAVVRRSLFGKSGPRQCKIGYISIRESEDLLELEEELGAVYDESWHYFIHFDGWNVKWDRWVAEPNIFPFADTRVKEYVERISQEHKALRNSMLKPGKTGKKAAANFDSAGFLTKWRRSVDRIDAEMKIPNAQLDIFRAMDHEFYRRNGLTLESHRYRDDVPETESSDEKTSQTKDNRKKSSKGKKDKPAAAVAAGATKESPTKTQKPKIKRKRGFSTVEEEKDLRKQSLTKRVDVEILNQIPLSDGLQKVLVDQWEVICQCGMLPVIPAPITIRQVLNQYLLSKGVDAPKTTDTKSGSDENVQAGVGPSTANHETTQNSEPTILDTHQEKPNTNTANDGETQETPAEDVTMQNSKNGADESTSDGNAALTKELDEEARLKRFHQDLVKAADGIAMFFDDALGNLLYKEEEAQWKVIATSPEFKGMRYSELYGPEHLLRLFMRLPEILEENLPSSEARVIIAKVNDFVRFLHKNHSSFFALKHGRPSAEILKQEERMLALMEKKRKIVEVE